MRKLIFWAAIIFAASMVQAQVKMPQLPAKSETAIKVPTDFIAPPALGDISKTKNDVVGNLMSSLSLGNDKKPALDDAIGSFLKDKSSILGLAKSSPTDYLSKFNPLQKGLFGKLNKIMGVAKFAQFMDLKPGKGTTHVLSNLFF